MQNLGLVLATLAAVVHGYIFWLESLAFERVGAKAFAAPPADVPAMKPWAFNQGFYNLFLGLGTLVGAVAVWSGHDGGMAWVYFGLACMLGAALVLALSDRSKLRGAVVQGTFPLLGLIALLLAR